MEQADLTPEQAELVKRQRAAESAAKERAERVLKDHPSNFSRTEELLRQARTADQQAKRIRLVLAAASAWGDEIAPIAACRRGCNACCHIPVVITSAEARLMAQASGRRVKVKPGSMTVAKFIKGADHSALSEGSEHRGVPCPFLVDGDCSIYESRPSACRTHFSLAEDDLLCRVVPGHPADVPFANATMVGAMAIGFTDAGEVLGDIRDFFPPVQEPAPKE